MATAKMGLSSLFSVVTASAVVLLQMWQQLLVQQCKRLAAEASHMQAKLQEDNKLDLG
jgi:hypothetical protein